MRTLVAALGLGLATFSSAHAIMPDFVPDPAALVQLEQKAQQADPRERHQMNKVNDEILSQVFAH